MTGDAKAELRALAHPLRLRILSLLTGQAMSAAEVARELGCTQANASYHLRVLASIGKVEIAEEVSVRGGRAVRYRYDAGHDSQRRTGPPGRHEPLVEALATELRRRTSSRDHAHPGHMTDAELWVTPQAWTSFCDAVLDASTRLHAEARPLHAPGTVRTSATISLFRMVEE